MSNNGFIISILASNPDLEYFPLSEQSMYWYVNYISVKLLENKIGTTITEKAGTPSSTIP